MLSNKDADSTESGVMLSNNNAVPPESRALRRDKNAVPPGERAPLPDKGAVRRDSRAAGLNTPAPFSVVPLYARAKPPLPGTRRLAIFTLFTRRRFI
jgi:hypothetical protein